MRRFAATKKLFPANPEIKKAPVSRLTPALFFCAELFLEVENIFERLLIDVAVELGEVRRELDRLRADFDAVLGISAAGDAAFFHERVETFGRVELSERVEIKKRRYRV